MSFLAERRRLLGWMALLAPLPLPFTQVLEWPFLIVYWSAVTLYLRRTGQEAVGWLPNWAMNLLGLGYLPILALDLTIFWRGQLLRPVVHLILFALVVKLFSIKRERDGWHALIGCFFLTLAAIGTSVHPVMLVYLTAQIYLHLLVMTRFATMHLLARFGRRELSASAIPVRRFLAGATLLTLFIAVPIFLVLPRIRSPYIIAPLAASEGLTTGTRFSGDLSLDATSRSRTNRAVALRFAFEPPGGELSEYRFKVATYDLFTGRGWQRTPPSREALRRGRDGFFRLADERFGARLRIWQLPSSSVDLAIPVEAVTVDLPVPRLVLGRGGALSLAYPTHALLEYGAGLGRSAHSAAEEPRSDDFPEPTLDLGGIGPRITELARQIAGDGPPLLRAQRIEAHLASRYGYTLEFVGRGAGRPVENFLFEHRRGHCELFASSMVLMLRAVGIPARFVVGFLGGENNALEDYYVVRQSDRHAWVEAWLPDSGWRIFDPTPAAGRPALADLGLEALLGQTWDYLVFRWDRYVLTYGVTDQLDLVFGVRRLLGWFGSRFRSIGEAGKMDLPPAAESEPAVVDPEGAEAVAPTVSSWLPFLLLMLVILVWLRIRSQPYSGQRAWQRLRRRLRQDGRTLPDHLPPLEAYRRLESNHPAAAEPGLAVLQLYLRESFNEETLDDGERTLLRDSLQQALRALRRSD